ncbi:MAG: MBL fold metallo-hydrolase [Paenibacillaceae bacterium]|nr:MBL fold metallo-hydrolase [Paenibacillaceae bacterium]
MEIAQRIHLIGGGKNGMQLTHELDCNVYAIDCGASCVLVDAGAGVAPERIVRRLEADGIPPERVSHLLLTHIHADHAGGAAYLRDRFGWSVVVSAEAAPWLASGDTDKSSVRQAIAAGLYPADYRYAPCPVDVLVSDGDTVAAGDLRFRVLETPGHARGHVCYLLEEDGVSSLFAGDTLFAGGKIYLQHSWDCHIQDHAASIARLHALRLDRLFAGHGPFLLEDAWRHAAKAHRAFERLDLPPNL